MNQLAELYRQHRQGLFSCALSVTRNAAEAEDAVHDAIARISKNGLEARSDPTAYIFQSVRNAALDKLRRRQTRVQKQDFIFIEHETRDQEMAGQRLADTEMRTLLREEIERLEDPYREVVVMKTISGLTFDQIARALDEPLSTVSSRYFRALKRLRAALEARL